MYDTFLVRAKSKTGLGIFTTVFIPPNVPVLEFTGEIFPEEKLRHEDSKLLQVGLHTWLGPSGRSDDYVNHSCAPNCGLHIVGNRAFLYSLYVIPANNEITFDYSTSSTDTIGDWKMECLCGAPNCRQIISGFQYLNPELQADYQKKGLVPLFMTNQMFSGR